MLNNMVGSRMIMFDNLVGELPICDILSWLCLAIGAHVAVSSNKRKQRKAVKEHPGTSYNMVIG